MRATVRIGLGVLLATTCLTSLASAQRRITTPKEQFGFTLGDDYQLANYKQLTEYWKKLDRESDRMKLVSIGKTAEGREQWMAIITSPANHARLDRLREISRRLARAEGLTDQQAKALAKEGRAVIWIDGGLHATEVLGSHQLMEHVYQMLSYTDEETMRLLDDVVQLVVHANPDGMDLVNDWYMRRSDPTKRTTAELPRLYQKYIGHDNNRDFYLNAMPESKNISRVLYREWYPQIMYNHHQTGPAGSVMFAPPFRDPHNHNLDPLLINTLGMVGNAMHTRFAAENKPGVVQREAASYQTWWNGGLRTTAYFHNQVGILTETIGSPTPMQIPVVPDRLVADGNGPFPIAPQPWRFRQSIDYSITANRAILDYASRYREPLLYNIYQMGRTAIAKGNEDSWTHYPKRVERLATEAAKDTMGAQSTATQRGPRSLTMRQFETWMRRPEDRDPRGYVLPSDQPDFLTATKFVNALIESGVDVHYATAAFSAGGKRYPEGSYVIRSAQAFRAHVLDMMEPQDYPNDLIYPGGPPKPPYDNAGYTLAMQMGVRYDRLLDRFDCPCRKIPDVLAKPPVSARMPGGSGFLLSRRVNDSYLAVNRLLAAKQRVEARGSMFYVAATPDAVRILQRLVDERGLPVTVGDRPIGALPVPPYRIGLWDQYGGSMPSGWVRYLLETFEFPFEVVYPPMLDRGNLHQRYDALVFVGGSIPAARADGPGRTVAMQPTPSTDIPEPYRQQLGRVTVERTVPALKSFLEQGGRVVTIGSATDLARHLGLPVDDHLVERDPAGRTRPLPREKFYVPTSILQVTVDTTAQSAAGMGAEALVTFDQSPVFRVPLDGRHRGIRPVAWFASAEPLRSGWAWGKTYLDGGVAIAEATVGKGTLFLFGPEVTFRAQPHGTFRFLFNGMIGR